MSGGDKAIHEPYVEPPFVESLYSMLLGVSPEGAVKDTDTDVSETTVAIPVGGFKTIPLEKPNPFDEPELKVFKNGI